MEIPSSGRTEVGAVGQGLATECAIFIILEGRRRASARQSTNALPAMGIK